MKFDVVFMLFLVGILLAILIVAVLVSPGPKKSRSRR